MIRQRLGQHFLVDDSWRARILASLGARADDVWIEIGAGHGEMTQLLAQEARRVIAIETDARLADGLRQSARAWPGVEIVHGDVLTLDLAALAGTRFRIYGNLPYYITSPIVHHLFRFADAVVAAHLVIQFEVAERIVARPGRRAYAYLSAFCQYYARPEIVLRIPPGAFRPPPKVTSAMVAMRLPGERTDLGIVDEQKFMKFIQGCFEHKRKTLRNNLRGFVTLESAGAVMAACGLRADARAEQLTLRQFAALFRTLFPAG